jgi:hypothetical protein
VELFYRPLLPDQDVVWRLSVSTSLFSSGKFSGQTLGPATRIVSLCQGWRSSVATFDLWEKGLQTLS